MPVSGDIDDEKKRMNLVMVSNEIRKDGLRTFFPSLLVFLLEAYPLCEHI